jgi:ATP-binding cassette subfamily G (WHITE) protein 2
LWLTFYFYLKIIAGKTTLLDILAGRKTVGKLSGEILFGGVAPSKMFLRRFTGYVEQQDTLVPNLTVEEFLRYTAELKIEVTVPAEEKSQAVERVIDQLALDTCRHTLIGSPNRRGISGGQGKRVNIGIALISNPHVLFLDEPTSGLDSYTSNEVMTVVKNLASTGITICATIHSPTPYSFSLFDRMLLLLSGKMVYFGRNGTQAIEYLHDNASDIATTTAFDENNIADWITDVTVVADRTGRADELAAKYEKSELKSHADKELDVQLRETRDLPPETAAALAVKRETTTPTLHAFKILVSYRLVRNYQSLEFYLSRAMPWLFQTLIIFSVFWQVGKDVQPANVANIVAIIFFWCISPAFAAASFVPAIMLSRPLYFRERNDGLFRPITFLMFLLAEELLVAIPVSFIVCTMMWFGVGLAGSYIMWWCTFAISFVVGISSAYFISAMSPNMDVANAAVPIYGVLCMFFSGFLQRVNSMGWWWRWYVYICIFHYSHREIFFFEKSSKSLTQLFFFLLIFSGMHTVHQPTGRCLRR